MLAQRRTKIVATLGPASSTEQSLEKLIRAGMNVARLNFSHGSHEDHKKNIDTLRRLSRKLGAPIAILQDLQGPKIRVGKLKGGRVELIPETEIKISTVIELGTEQILSTDFKELPLACKPGTKILLDDGKMELKVIKVDGPEITCRVIYGGPLTDRKGMNLPGVSLPVDGMTAKDLADLEFGLSQKVDYVALSFVRQASDIRKLREIIEARRPGTKIVAKIEMLEALQNLVEIIEASDAVMVARGDLMVEVGAAQLPLAQKRIIALSNEIGRPVITATQMLDSMVENPAPTRAEITDVANAVLDGSDALMLSAETASGKYPAKCIATMDEIIVEVERTSSNYYDFKAQDDMLETAEAIAGSASLCAMNLDAKAIICLTSTGRTATLISNIRPKAQVIACTYNLETLNRLELVWGVQTLEVTPYQSSEDAMKQIQQRLLDFGIVEPGDRIIMTLGMPVQQGSKTNTVRVFVVQDRDKQELAEQEKPLRWQEQTKPS